MYDSFGTFRRSPAKGTVLLKRFTISILSAWNGSRSLQSQWEMALVSSHMNKMITLPFIQRQIVHTYWNGQRHREAASEPVKSR